MHHTNQRTLNGRMTKQQTEEMEYKIGQWIYNKLKNTKTNVTRITYGQISRKFKISYHQTRNIIKNLIRLRIIANWNAPNTVLSVDKPVDKQWINSGKHYTFNPKV